MPNYGKPLLAPIDVGCRSGCKWVRFAKKRRRVGAQSLQVAFCIIQSKRESPTTLSVSVWLQLGSFCHKQYYLGGYLFFREYLVVIVNQPLSGQEPQMATS
jgi:hypothetical protein